MDNEKNKKLSGWENHKRKLAEEEKKAKLPKITKFLFYNS